MERSVLNEHDFSWTLSKLEDVSVRKRRSPALSQFLFVGSTRTC